MHELGVVFHVIRQVKEIAKENEAQKILSVTLQLGEVSGVIPEYLTDCWQWAVKREEIVNEAVLVIEPILAVTHCEACGRDYETVKYARICPYCQSGNTYLLKGNEFRIKEIEVE